MKGIFIDNESMDIMIDNNFKSLNLIYKGKGVNTSVSMPISSEPTPSIAVSVTSKSPPVFFGLSYNKGTSIYVTPLITFVDGDNYTCHFYRHENSEFFVFSTDMPIVDSEYGIRIYGDNNEELFNSALKPMRIIAAGNVRTHRGINDFIINEDISTKKIAIGYSPNEGIAVYGEAGPGVRTIYFPTLRVVNNKQVYFEQFLVLKTQKWVDWYIYGNGTGTREETYLLCIDVTDL